MPHTQHPAATHNTHKTISPNASLALAALILTAAALLAATPSTTHTSNTRQLANAHWLVDINTAPTHTLELLPNIGPVLAQRITHDRPFTNPLDLQRVRGIGPITADQLTPHVTFNH